MMSVPHNIVMDLINVTGGNIKVVPICFEACVMFMDSQNVRTSS